MTWQPPTTEKYLDKLFGQNYFYTWICKYIPQITKEIASKFKLNFEVETLK